MPRRKALSIAELEQALEAVKQHVARLRKERDQLGKRAEKLDEQIAKLRGAGVAALRAQAAAPEATEPETKRRKLPKNKMPLKEAIVAVLSGSPEAMTAKEIADAVLASGYQSGSKDFLRAIWGTIYDDERIERPERGKFQVKAQIE